MSIHLDWLRTGRAPRGTPAGRGPSRRLLTIGLIALAMIESGCQSGLSGCGSCKSCDSCGFFRRTTARIFNRPSRSYDTGIVGDSAVDYSGPSPVVAPSTTTGPLYSPQSGTTTVPSTVPPASGPGEIQLEPAPSAKPGGPPSTGSTSGSGAGRTSYLARPSATKTAVRIDSGLTTERASIARPTRQPSKDGASEATGGDDDNPLDHLPPLALPGEVTQSATASPAPSASRPEGKTGDAPVGKAAARSTDEKPEDGVSLAADLTAEPEPATTAGTGIARFAPVDPKLAGGSVPSTAGLGWLAEKGYRTVLDLRPSREVSPAFIAEVVGRGLRYVALPVNLDQLDPDRLARFQFELAAPEARPLFFFDSDGSRAGALWYIRRVAVDQVDPQMARREAEEIGLKDQAAWRSAAAYLDRLEATRVHPAPSPTRADAADPPSPPSVVTATTDRLDSSPRFREANSPNPTPAPGPTIASTTALDLPSTMIPPLPAPPKTGSAPPDGLPHPALPMQNRSTWRPLAAMLLTGLSLPLVYWSRTAIPDAIARARASLPAPAPRPRSLPQESGE